MGGMGALGDNRSGNGINYIQKLYVASPFLLLLGNGSFGDNNSGNETGKKTIFKATSYGEITDNQTTLGKLITLQQYKINKSVNKYLLSLISGYR